jgi:hypothetical protein
VLNVNIYTESTAGEKDASQEQEVIALPKEDPSKPPKWKKRDELHLVPLVPGAKSGALPIEVEEGLSYAC